MSPLQKILTADHSQLGTEHKNKSRLEKFISSSFYNEPQDGRGSGRESEPDSCPNRLLQTDLRKHRH